MKSLKIQILRWDHNVYHLNVYTKNTYVKITK